VNHVSSPDKLSALFNIASKEEYFCN